MFLQHPTEQGQAALHQSQPRPEHKMHLCLERSGVGNGPSCWPLLQQLMAPPQLQEQSQPPKGLTGRGLQKGMLMRHSLHLQKEARQCLPDVHVKGMWHNIVTDPPCFAQLRRPDA